MRESRKDRRLIPIQATLSCLQLDLPRRLHGEDVVGAIDRAGDLKHADPPVGQLAANQRDIAAVPVTAILLPPRPESARAGC